jgi:hypothetical protein
MNHENVVRLDVPQNNALAMGCRQSVTDLCSEVQDLFKLESLPAAL